VHRFIRLSSYPDAPSTLEQSNLYAPQQIEAIFSY